MSSVGYNDQVFINCPFDREFLDIFRAFCFTILDCGFVPRCSLEIDDASQFRLKAIIDMIEDCKYGLHDLSRVEIDKKSKLPRFNMPFEFGIFYGAKMLGNRKHKNKQCVVMEKEKYRYQKFISDISGIDVTPHGHSVKRTILGLRNWLVTASRRTSIPPAEQIYSRYLKFQRDLEKICKTKGIDHRTMPFIETVQNMTDWLKLNQILKQPLFA
jgi:hypothetical protein